MTDQQIIQLLRDHRPDKAFTRLYRYLPVVQKMVLARGGSKDDALDVFQDALVILCKKIQDPAFTLTASIDTYLYSVSRFLWNENLRKKQKQQETGMRENFDVPEETLHEWVKDEEKIGLAESVLQKIGARCLKLLQLFYNADLSMKTIAKKMEFTSENAAKNQKYKCIERAKSMLRETENNAIK